MDSLPTVETRKQFYTGLDTDDSNCSSGRSYYDRLFYRKFRSILF